VSQKPAYVRSDSSHDVTALSVLELHARTSGWTRCLPVPIEGIVQDTYGMRVVWNDVAEMAHERILGVLHPKAGVIVLNRRHRDVLSTVVGPLRFTLAHELGHWLYDADRESELFDHPVFCRRLSAADPRQVREVNANRLAAALLLPSDLVRAAFGRSRARVSSAAELNDFARDWGVSRQTLRIRLEGLGLGWCLPPQPDW
jgi:Zn-dependent peptidase ImmA (M78 family)